MLDVICMETVNLLGALNLAFSTDKGQGCIYMSLSPYLNAKERR